MMFLIGMIFGIRNFSKKIDYDKIFDKWFSKCKKENDRLIVRIV